MVWPKVLFQREMKVEEEMEEGLGSIGKLRILRTLAKDVDKYYTRYALEKQTGLKSISLKNSLRDLRTIGWVIECGRKPKKYRLNKDNHIVSYLLDFFRKIGYI